MAKTIHVIQRGGSWTVKRQGRKADGVYDTKREAVASARDIARNASGQLVIHGVDGKIQEHDTYGMPRIQKAVEKVTLDRLFEEQSPPRG